MRKARLLREAKGLTLRDVENEVGCDHSAIGRFEQGKGFLREENLRAYARLLDATLDEISDEVTDEASAARQAAADGE